MDSVALHSTIAPITFVFISIAILMVTGTCVVVRVTTQRLHNGGLFPDDYLSVVALVFLIGATASTYMTLNLSDGNVDMAPLFKASLVLTILVTLSMWFAKTPILFLYIRLFGIKRWVRLICYITLIATLLQFIAISVLLGASCIPAGKGGDDIAEVAAVCISRGFAVGIWNGIISIITDLIIFLIPIPIVFQLQLPTRKKIGICVVFAAGLWAIAASSVSFYYKVMVNIVPSGDFSIPSLCTLIECSIAVMVSCVPSLHLFWTSYIAKIFVFLRSQLRPVYSGPISRSGRSYVELEEGGIARGG